jgi:alpha-beta hydrolase superfamily lysophospholipase
MTQTRPEIVTQSATPRGWVLVAHGMNLRPSRMQPLAEAVCNAESGLACRILTLEGHEEGIPSRMRQVTAASWKATMLEEIRWIREQAGEKPVFFLGFSLGSLMGAWAMQQFEENPFERAVLLAPPIETHAYARLAALIPGPSHWTLPSRNHPEYRANSGTSLGAYRALFAIQDELRNAKPRGRPRQDDVLALVNPDDELVSARKLRRRAEKSGWSHWQIEDVLTLRPSLRPVYQHLFIDEPSMGSEAWEHLVSRIRSQISHESEYPSPDWQ